MPGIDVWRARLGAVPMAHDAHCAAWKDFVQHVASRRAAWAREHMSLDIVAV
jgi:hypothetical protein